VGEQSRCLAFFGYVRLRSGEDSPSCACGFAIHPAPPPKWYNGGKGTTTGGIAHRWHDVHVPTIGSLSGERSRP
jgi:hypothetical protein